MLLTSNLDLVEYVLIAACIGIIVILVADWVRNGYVESEYDDDNQIW